MNSERRRSSEKRFFSFPHKTDETRPSTDELHLWRTYTVFHSTHVLSKVQQMEEVMKSYVEMDYKFKRQQEALENMRQTIPRVAKVKSFGYRYLLYR